MIKVIKCSFKTLKLARHVNEEKSLRAMVEQKVRKLEEDAQSLEKECEEYKRQCAEYKQFMASLSDELTVRLLGYFTMKNIKVWPL